MKIFIIAISLFLTNLCYADLTLCHHTDKNGKEIGIWWEDSELPGNPDITSEKISPQDVGRYEKAQKDQTPVKKSLEDRVKDLEDIVHAKSN